jgi:hypothetical protein
MSNPQEPSNWKIKAYSPKEGSCRECGSVFLKKSPSHKYCKNPCGSKEWRADQDKKARNL